ncbi:MAG TPA: hypothetical protein V6D05_06315, partial [Stenomitos sp.]
MPTETVNEQEPGVTAATKSSALASLRAVGAVLAISWPTIVDAKRNRLTPKIVDERAKWLGDKIIRLARAKVEVEGLDQLDPSRSYLFMSNHESLMDIPL